MMVHSKAFLGLLIFSLVLAGVLAFRTWYREWLENFEFQVDYVHVFEANTPGEALAKNLELSAPGPMQYRLTTGYREVPGLKLTHDDVRKAGGIVHSDGNIFFTNIDKLNAAINGATT